MLTEDNTFDFLRQVNGLEIAVNAFYNYFRHKNIEVDESYINCFDQIINPNKSDEFFPNELSLNYEKNNEQIIQDFKNYDDNNIETESKLRTETTDTKTKIKDSPSKVTNVNNVTTICKLINKKYSCKKCGKLYINTDGVRKHWRNKHSESKLKRGNIHNYATIIIQTTEQIDVDNKVNQSPDNIELTCYETL